MAGKVFINYRREDAKADAGRIHDRLVRAFGTASIFMDVDHLAPGQVFEQELDKALARSDVFLAVIGPRWLELLHERARSGNHDYARHEIARALERGIFIVPVLVGGSAVPRRGDLPDDLQHLVRYQTINISFERFGRDVAELVEVIKRQRRLSGRRFPWTLAAASTAAALLAAIGAAMWWVRSGVSTIDVRQLAVGESFRECTECPEMVVIPAAEFLMGSPANEPGRAAAESPQHRVRIPRPLAVSKYEVMVKEYEAFAEATGGVADGSGCHVWTAYGHRFENDRSFRSPSFSQLPNHPVVCVSWQAASTYANWLTTRTGKKYRLLSEAEWEYAARAGSSTRYFFGDDEAKLCDYGNGADRTSAFLWGNHLCSDGAGVQTTAVGKYRPNGFGLYDTSGNAWEWVEDCMQSSYDAAPTDGRPWMNGDCKQRGIRGGSWDSGSEGLRSATRGSYPLQPKDNIGFRVAREID